MSDPGEHQACLGMWRSVLTQAIRDATRAPTAYNYLDSDQRRAIDWFKPPFQGLAAVCGILDLDPAMVSRKVLAKVDEVQGGRKRV